MMRWVGVTVLVLLAVVAGCSTPPKEEGAATDAPVTDLAGRVEAYLQPWIERGDFKGVVLIAKGEEILLHQAWGLDGTNVQGDPRDAVFRIGAVTKPFTAAAILLLRDAGRLSLADTLDRFIPNFPSAGKITIEQLLTHASGVPDPNPELFFTQTVDLDAVLRSIASKEPHFEPGTSNRYSNGGYNVLARVVEAASGESWADYTRRAMFEPLGMRSTGDALGAPAATKLVAGYLPGPGPGGVMPAPQLNMAAAIGSGSLASTTTDLHRWALAVADGKAFSYEGLAWPVGWGKLNLAGREGLEQTAVLPGYSASLSLFPDDRLVVVCLNAVEAGSWSTWSGALLMLARDMEPPPVELPAPGAALSASDRARYVGHYESEQRTMRIEDLDGLFMFLGDWPVGKYLTSAADGGFFPRGASGTMRFEPDGAGQIPQALHWTVSDTELVFERVEAGARSGG